jgi:hydroxymethylpyrimidine/phosphomethylpyrimidine kinase
MSVPDAVGLAKAFVTEAIRRAYPVGQGSGPLHHLYALDDLDDGR